jgi:hypothetical protein
VFTEQPSRELVHHKIKGINQAFTFCNMGSILLFVKNNVTYMKYDHLESSYDLL